MLILDGGLATELERRGHCLDTHLWSARMLQEKPAEIAAVHRSYLEAGADCITTASYQASLEGFVRTGLTEERAEQLIIESVGLAHRVVDEFVKEGKTDSLEGRPLILASVGPYGAFLANGAEYTGDYPVGFFDLVDFHKRRWELLLSARPDVMLCETIPSFTEVKAICQVAREFSCPRIWISFSCRNAAQISDETPVHLAARWVSDHSDVEAIGINCVPPGDVVGLINEIRRGTNRNVFAYPNSGEVYDANAGDWSGEQNNVGLAISFAAWEPLELFAVGGCCRTTPQDIQDLSRIVRADSAPGYLRPPNGDEP